MKYNGFSPKNSNRYYSKKFRERPLVGRSISSYRMKKAPEKIVRALPTNLESVWEVKNIPEEISKIYRKLFLLLPKDKASEFMLKEAEELANNESLTQRILQDIKAREGIIRSIEEIDKKLSRIHQWELLENKRSECKELLDTHRRLTLMTVENIHEWKENLEETLKMSGLSINFEIDFLWKGFSYMNKIKNDINFIEQTELSSLFKFSKTPDPFLLTPCQGQLDSQTIDRIRVAEKMLFGTFFYVKTHISTKGINSLPRLVLKTPWSVTADALVEEVVSSECKRIAKECIRLTSEELDDQVSLLICKKLVDKIVKNLVVEEIIESDIARYLLDKIINQECQNVSALFFKTKEVDSKISNNLFGKLIREEIYAQCEDLVSTMTTEMISESILTDFLGILSKDLLSIAAQEEIETVEELFYEFGDSVYEYCIDILSKEIASESLIKMLTKDSDPKKLSENILEEFIQRECRDIAIESSDTFIQEMLFRDLLTICIGDVFKIEEDILDILSPIIEAFIRKECKEIAVSQFQIQEMSKALPKKIVQSFVKEFIHTECKSVAQEYSNNILALAVYNDLIAEEANWVNSYTASIILKRNTEVIQNDIYNDLVDSLMKELCETEYKTTKLSNSICEDYIDDVVRTLIHYSTAKFVYLTHTHRELSRLIVEDLAEILIFKYTSLEAISQLILEELIDSHFFSVDELIQLMEEVRISEKKLALELASPVAYSPEHTFRAEESPSAPLSQRSMQFNALELNIDHIFGEELPSFTPLGILEASLRTTLEEYYGVLPEDLKKISLPIDLLTQEAFEGVDPSWFWLTSSNQIAGLIVFSYQASPNLGAHIVIHHMSTLNSMNYEKGLTAAIDFLRHRANYIRLDIYGDLPMDKKKIYSQLKLKWKSDSGELVHMGLDTFSNIAFSENVIRTVCTVEVSDSKVANPITSVNMIETGNRLVQLSALLPRLQGFEAFDEPENKLQEDLIALLEILASAEGFVIPNTEVICSSNMLDLKRFAKKAWNKTLPLLSGKQSISALNVAFHWKSCSHVTIDNIRYAKLKNPVYKENLGFEIYEVSIDLSNYKAFFIRSKNLLRELQTELKHFNTDLQYKTENILKGAEISARTVREIWVPLFKKQIEWEVPWVNGIAVGEGYVKRVFEGITVCMNSPMLSEGCLESEHPNRNLFDSEFIFGLVEIGVEALLEIPSFVCLVQRENWISY